MLRQEWLWIFYRILVAGAEELVQMQSKMMEKQVGLVGIAGTAQIELLVRKAQ